MAFFSSFILLYVLAEIDTILYHLLRTLSSLFMSQYCSAFFFSFFFILLLQLLDYSFLWLLSFSSLFSSFLFLYLITYSVAFNCHFFCYLVNTSVDDFQIGISHSELLDEFYISSCLLDIFPFGCLASISLVHLKGSHQCLLVKIAPSS